MNKIDILVRNIFILILMFFGIASFSATEDQDPHFGLEQSVDSHDCLECHDGLRAEHPMNHPFEISYPEARIRRPGAVLKPIFALPSAIRLINGRVVCITCHDIESILPYRLRLTMEHSALCFACHDR